MCSWTKGCLSSLHVLSVFFRVCFLLSVGVNSQRLFLLPFPSLSFHSFISVMAALGVLQGMTRISSK